VGYAGRDRIGLFVRRASAAGFIADQLDSSEYVRESPMICDARR
jgi:hypothetical protein